MAPRTRRGPTASWRKNWAVVERLSRYEAAVQFIQIGDGLRLQGRLGRPLPEGVGNYMNALRERLDLPQ